MTNSILLYLDSYEQYLEFASMCKWAKRPAVAPKCRTLKRPQLSCKFGLKEGINNNWWYCRSMEKSPVCKSMSSLIHLWYSTIHWNIHFYQIEYLSHLHQLVHFRFWDQLFYIFLPQESLIYYFCQSLTLIAIKYGTLSCKMSISFFQPQSRIIYHLAFIISIPKSSIIPSYLYQFI